MAGNELRVCTKPDGLNGGLRLSGFYLSEAGGYSAIAAVIDEGLEPPAAFNVWCGMAFYVS